MKPCFPAVLVCEVFDHDTEPELLQASIERRRVAVSALLDGGHSEVAREGLGQLAPSP